MNGCFICHIRSRTGVLSWHWISYAAFT